MKQLIKTNHKFIKTLGGVIKNLLQSKNKQIKIINKKINKWDDLIAKSQINFLLNK